MLRGKEWKDGTRLLGRRGEDPARKQRRCLWTLPSRLLNGQKRGKHKHPCIYGRVGGQSWMSSHGWRHSILSEGVHMSICCRRGRGLERTLNSCRGKDCRHRHTVPSRRQRWDYKLVSGTLPLCEFAQFSSKCSSPTEEQGGSGGVVSKLCPTLCGPVDCSPPGSSVRETPQARTLDWVAISSSRASSWPRDRMRVSCLTRQIPYHWAT